MSVSIDPWAACSHEPACPFALYVSNKTLFDKQPACSCGGETLAKMYFQRSDEPLSERLRREYPHFDDLLAHEQRALVEAELDKRRQDDEWR